jgi:glycosidase
MEFSVQWLEKNSQRTLDRLFPRLESRFAKFVKSNPKEWDNHLARIDQNFEKLFSILLHLYKDRYDFFYHLEELLAVVTQSWIDRPADLKALDIKRESHPNWFQSNQMVEGVCYVDLFAGDLAGIRSKIAYFKELRLTALHLMPLFKVPQGENDGGYAISSYREVDPKLGTIEELKALAADFRQDGISLVVDFVFNHTSNQHEWAMKALEGVSEYQDFYRIFPDRRMPDAYEQHLREIFPDEHPGAFTFNKTLNQWVWTTFHSYQWDLNYANPAVFISMAGEMLFLANAGVEILRLDAVAFTWKQLGTNCENLPEAHLLIQAYNAIARIASPAMLFKSEAIVHPDDVAKYIDPGECQLSYNPLLMALLWEALATRNISLLSTSLTERFQIDPQCTWINYVRCHDDIGWTFSDEDAAKIWINGYDHRRFLNAFYTGRFEGSFARGLPFQENPKTGDARISGTCASLAGLEKALQENNPAEVDLAIRRILLIHSVILTIGGIPLIYLNDELGILNDYSYRDDPAKAHDSRWVHRPAMDWEKAASRKDKDSLQYKIFQNLKKLIELRKSNIVFSGSDMQIIDSGNQSVLGYLRTHGSERILIFANFSEGNHIIPANLLRLYGLGYTYTDLLQNQTIPFADLTLEPYQFVCLTA